MKEKTIIQSESQFEEVTDDKQSKCDHCGDIEDEYIMGNVFLGNFNGKLKYQKWCKKCLKNCFTCNKCMEKCPNELKKEVYNKDRYRRIELQNWCNTCFYDHATYCDCCQSFWCSRETSQTVNGAEICPKCMQNGEYDHCYDCGNIFFHEDLLPDRRGNKYCESCYEEHRCLQNILHPDASPLSREYGLEYDRELLTGTTKPYMGIELEVIPDDLPTATDQVNSIVREQSKWALLKEEGSVSEGFEICTVPMLIDKHYRIWKEDFENQKFDLHQHGKNCGMHIHLNRASVTKIGLGRLVFLIYGQQSNIRFTKLIAERSPGIYWGTDPKEISQIMRYPFYSDKFEALNLQHRDSLEFRMFRSDTSSNAIFKGLEYVAACREFCNNEIFIRPYWYNFVEWVFKNKTTYPHLTAFLEEKKEEGYFDESSMRIMAEQDYLNTLFKKATKDVAYYEEDNDGSRIWCSVDGDNWWKETKEGIFPICGEVPSNFHSMKKLPIEDLMS